MFIKLKNNEHSVRNKNTAWEVNRPFFLIIFTNP